MEEHLSPPPPTRQAFAQLIAPLERAAGSRFGNPHRRETLKLYAQNPDGVREVALGALRDRGSNPIGLFVWRLQNGWAELEPLPHEAFDAGGRAWIQEYVHFCVDCDRETTLNRDHVCEECWRGRLPAEGNRGGVRPTAAERNGNSREPRGSGWVENLSSYTGCRYVRGSHGMSEKYDPLGTDRPPVDWPYARPTREEIRAAIAERGAA